MMYWIVFAIFMAAETFTDIFISWSGPRIGRPWGWEGPHHHHHHHLASGSHKPLPLLTHRFPFYYEFKMAFVLWLLSPYTKGASLLYRKFVHPSLSRHEKVPLREIEQKQEGVSGQCVRAKALYLRFRQPEVPGSYSLSLYGFAVGL